MVSPTPNVPWSLDAIKHAMKVKDHYDESTSVYLPLLLPLLLALLILQPLSGSITFFSNFSI